MARAGTGRIRRGPALALTAALLLLAALFTWPLLLHFGSAIPYTLHPQEGYELYPLMPGDHLQTYFWFWLAADNVLGDSPFHTNPYEFNGPNGPMVGGYANFPFSLLYVALSPLGDVAAYNLLVLLSFIACGLAGWLFAACFVRDRWAPLLAGLLFAAFPARVSSLAGGQLFGFLVFLLPAVFWLVEKAAATGRWPWAAGAAACFALMGAMEGHVAFFGTLFMGLYLPGRLLLSPPPEDAREAEAPVGGPPGVGVSMVAAAGLAVGLAAALRAGAGVPGGWRGQLPVAAACWIPAILVAWLAAAALLGRLTGSPFAVARDAAARVALPFLILPFGAAAGGSKAWKATLLVAAAAAAILLVRLVRRLGPVRPAIPWRGAAVAAAGAGVGIGIASALLLSHRAKNIVSSIAGKGRSLGEVMLFSSDPGGLVAMGGGGRERYVVLGAGLILLAGLGLAATLRRRPPADSGRRALFGLIGLLGGLLSVGPTLAAFPLYRELFEHLPFFSYPRVPGRFVPIAILFLGVLACDAVADLSVRIPDRGRILRPILLVAAAAILLVPLHSFRPMGLSLFPKDDPLAGRIAARTDAGRGLVLELPLWPGDSHQSSLYEYDVTRTRRPMVNGYSPLVSREYLEKVAAPLSPLNVGQLGEAEATVLREARVGLVTFHDDQELYPAKVGPFPPRLAERRLAASPWLEPLGREGKVSLFGLRDAPRPGGRPEAIVSPAAFIAYAFSLSTQVGTRGWDPEAAGYRLQTEDGAGGIRVPARGAVGNVIASPAGSADGWLVKGPAKGFPAGSYEAAFRLRSPRGAPVAGALEIADATDGRIIASRPLLPADFAGAAGGWTDLTLPFVVGGLTQVEWRVRREGPAPLDANLVIVRFAGAGTGPGALEAEDLYRQTGAVVADAAASGGEAVVARAGSDPPLYLVHGPYRTVPPGRYVARFHVRAAGGGTPAAPLARFEVAADMGRWPFAVREVAVGDLEAGSPRTVDLPFAPPVTAELDLRVRFGGGADLAVDRVEILTAP